MTTPVQTHLHKPADTQYPILDVIKNRFSPRTFDTRPIEQDKLMTVLEAARWAASSMNTQPWRFIIATRGTDGEFEKMLSILKEGNQNWAKNAPILLLAVARDEHDGGYKNNHSAHDIGQALANLSLQATQLDLFVRMMGGFYPDKAREVYNIPEGYTPITALALGYLGTLEQLDERLQEREQTPRTRKPLSELVFTDNWDNTADFVK